MTLFPINKTKYSVKDGTSDRKLKVVIRRIIGVRNVLLHTNCSDFLCCSRIKTELACFLSNKAPEMKAVGVSGGFRGELVVEYSCQLIDTHPLREHIDM